MESSTSKPVERGTFRQEENSVLKREESELKFMKNNITAKKMATYHICLSSKEEVMFRSNADYNRAFNCYAIALHKTGSISLADSFMSNHFHLIIRSSNPQALVYHMRNSYAKYFNRKYKRSGKLGAKKHFCIEIKGLYHHLAAISYVLRNPLHHGVTPTPFAYRYSSSNAIFKNELGKKNNSKRIEPKHFYRYIGRHAVYPQSYVMNEQGAFTRESVTDTKNTEYIYSTARAFNYYMSRKTSEEWLKEQDKDEINTPPITIAAIEEAFLDTCYHTNNTFQKTSIHNSSTYAKEKQVNKMLAHENGRTDYDKISDIQLCEEIDSIIDKKHKGKTIYTLGITQKEQLIKTLSAKYKLSKRQLQQCFIYNP